MNSKVRLYFSDRLTSGEVLNLSENQSHYVKNVIKLKQGDKISLFNSLSG
jgi:16S rRNA U1498 N3-methylase RsmE